MADKIATDWRAWYDRMPGPSKPDNTLRITAKCHVVRSDYRVTLEPYPGPTGDGTVLSYTLVSTPGDWPVWGDFVVELSEEIPTDGGVKEVRIKDGDDWVVIPVEEIQ